MTGVEKLLLILSVQRSRPTKTVLDSALISSSQRQPVEFGRRRLEGDQQRSIATVRRAIDRMLGDKSDDVAQVDSGIKAIQFGGADQCVDCSAAFATAV